MAIFSFEPHSPELDAVNIAVSRLLRGAQHELGFGQILEQCDVEFREADAGEDMGGTDYFVFRRGGNRELKLDVKASLTEIEKRHRTDNLPYAVRPDSSAIVHSGIEDREFADSFFIPNELAQQKAAKLEPLLELIERKVT